jgi:protein-L-isoaspartate(D-aspartate) O-methyltransferase
MNKILSQTNMIKQQLRTGNITNQKIIDLYQTISRDDFAPLAYRKFSYSDMQIPLAHQQRMLTPLEEASILQALALQGHETVLEIGTGTGFFSALLSHCAKRVVSVDYFEDFTLNAKKHCAHHGRNNIDFFTGDGHNGWVNLAPYDVIVITGAIPGLSDVLKLQVCLGGKVFAIVGKHPTLSGYLFQVDHQNHWTQKLIFETDIPQLIDNSRHQHFVF